MFDLLLGALALEYSDESMAGCSLNVPIKKCESQILFQVLLM